MRRSSFASWFACAFLVVACDSDSGSEGATDGAGTGSTGGVTGEASSSSGGASGTTQPGTTGGSTGAGDTGSTSVPSTSGEETGSAESSSGGASVGEPMWMVVGNWGYRSWTSDGQTWEVEANPKQGDDHTPDLMRGVGWGNGYFVAVGGDQNSMVMRSADGQAWDVDLHPSGTQWKGDVAYGDGRWVAVGGVGTVISSDDDGQTWVDHEERLPAAGRKIEYADGVFVAVGDGGMIAVSDDGMSWADQTQPGTQSGSAAFAHGTWVVAGRQWNGSGFDASCVLSTDAQTWSPCPFGGEYIRAIATDDRLFVVRDGGYAVTDDGAAWTEHDVSTPDFFARGGDVWVGAGGSRRYLGDGVDALEEVLSDERGIRDFVMGYVD